MGRCERNRSCIGVRALVGMIRMWEVSVVIVRISKWRSRCKLSATTASTPRIGILDGAGKIGRGNTAVVVCRDGMLCTLGDIAMVVHVVGMVQLTIIAI